MLKTLPAPLEVDTSVRCGSRWCAAYMKIAMPTRRVMPTFTYWYYKWAFVSRYTPIRVYRLVYIISLDVYESIQSLYSIYTAIRSFMRNVTRHDTPGAPFLTSFEYLCVSSVSAFSICASHLRSNAKSISSNLCSRLAVIRNETLYEYSCKIHN